MLDRGVVRLVRALGVFFGVCRGIERSASRTMREQGGWNKDADTGRKQEVAEHVGAPDQPSSPYSVTLASSFWIARDRPRTITADPGATTDLGSRLHLLRTLAPSSTFPFKRSSCGTKLRVSGEEENKRRARDCSLQDSTNQNAPSSSQPVTRSQPSSFPRSLLLLA